MSEDGVSYFYDRRRAVLSLVLEDESLRCAPTGLGPVRRPVLT